jgi:aspartokinase/homoserine dehydrogenase 1
VLKFGGSSLATPERIAAAGRIVLGSVNGSLPVVVVSALQGVTNQLIECARTAERRDVRFEQSYQQLAARHCSTADALLDATCARSVRSLIAGRFDALHDVLHGIRLLGHCPPAALDAAASFGELLSALIVAAYLNRFRPTEFVDAREFVITDEHFTRATVDSERTDRAIRQYFSSFWRDRPGVLPVITGFIGRTEDGRTTTIGRNGSDCTAAIVGGALDATGVEIWTDVDGILSADPKIVSSAFGLRRMSYQAALEMSHFGAKGLHQGTIAPVLAKSIPIIIRNTLNPTARGTFISRKSTRAAQSATGINSLREVSLLTVRGNAGGGSCATAERIFRVLALSGVNPLFSCQAPWEPSIGLGISAGDIAAASKALEHEFRHELKSGAMSLEHKSDQTMIAVVGDGVNGRTDAAGRVLAALSRHEIAVNAFARGGSGSVSCLVDGPLQSRALNVLHREFFDRRRPFGLAVIGVGGVGRELLGHLRERREFLRRQGFDVTVIAIADSKRFVVSRDGVDLDRWRELLDASDRQMDPRELARQIASLNLADAALVDCTAAASIVDAYPDFIKANLHIITPNKLSNVLPWRRHDALRRLFAAHRKHFLYETNVGAGLPILSTVRHLVASGDAIRRVEGVFSGTLGYLFNSFDGTVPFSELVRDAHHRGFTEPDPREDLTGRDVARKLLILARQVGLRMDLDDVAVESLLPPGLYADGFSNDFFAEYSSGDAAMAGKLECARANGSVLRYVGVLEGGRAYAGLRTFPRGHRFASTAGSDNVIALTTDRYASTPLIVQGPGAGAAVTATGVFSDIFRLLHYLPSS